MNNFDRAAVATTAIVCHTAAIVDTNTIEQQVDCSDRHVLHRDYETRSRLALKSVGTYRYVADPSTEVLCCA